jgi:hypothetical protein
MIPEPTSFLRRGPGRGGEQIFMSAVAALDLPLWLIKRGRVGYAVKRVTGSS